MLLHILVERCQILDRRLANVIVGNDPRNSGSHSQESQGLANTAILAYGKRSEAGCVVYQFAS